MAFSRMMVKTCCLLALGIFMTADAQDNDTACDENATGNDTACDTTTTMTTTTTMEEVEVNGTDNDTEVAVTPAPAPVPMTVITFSLTLTTSATCADLAASTAMMTAFKRAGSRLAGDVSTDAVTLTCAAARRLLGAFGRRLQSTGIALTFEVTVPTSEAAASQASIEAIDLATATTIFNDAATDAGGSFTFTVDEAALTAMKASVVATAITPAPAPVPAPPATSAPSGGESGFAFDGKKPAKIVAALVAALSAFAMGA